MIRPGSVIENPLTGSRTVVLEAGERGFLLEVACAPGARADVKEHFHRDWTESFEIVRGVARYRLGGREATATAGETVRVPAGVPHVHPFSTGGSLLYRQRSEFAAPDPTAAAEVLGVFATLAGLAREGRTGRAGLPRNPLRTAAALRALARHGGYDAALGERAQDLLAATLGRVAEALGYRGADPRYLP